MSPTEPELPEDFPDDELPEDAPEPDPDADDGDGPDGPLVLEDDDLDKGEPDDRPAVVTKAIEVKTIVMKRIDRRALAKRIFGEMDGDE